jgi:hypothetical protein
MTDREAMKMALAKLEHLWEIGIDVEYKVELLPEIEALRQALAQPEQEPVNVHCPSCLHSFSIVPVAKREWVSLTDEQIETIVDLHTSDDAGYDIFCDGHGVARAIEAKLKEKNT